MSKRYVIYARVSTASQEDGTSLDTQVAACRALIAERGGEVVEVAREIMSGSLYLARSELQRAIGLVEAREADGLVMLDLERFARHAAYQEIAYARVRRAGGVLLFVREEFEDTPEGGLARGVRAVVSQYYREKQRVLSMEGLRARATAGRMPQCSKPPYGYRVTSRRDVDRGIAESAGIYYFYEPEISWARHIYGWHAQGNSLNEITRMLTDANAPTMRGGRWQNGTVYSILTNPVYCGRAAYGKTRVFVDEERMRSGVSHVGRVRVPSAEWILIPAPAIVSVEAWQAGIERLRKAGGRRLDYGNKTM